MYNSPSKISKLGKRGIRKVDLFSHLPFRMQIWQTPESPHWMGNKAHKQKSSCLGRPFTGQDQMCLHEGRMHKAPGPLACPILLPLLATGSNFLILWLPHLKPDLLCSYIHSRHAPKHVHSERVLTVRTAESEMCKLSDLEIRPSGWGRLPLEPDCPTLTPVAL